MREPNIKYLPSGHIDVVALETGMDTSLMGRWILLRLGDQDCWGPPLDRNNLETPQQLFYDIYFRSEPHSLLRKAIGKSCRALLDKAWQNPSAWPGEGILDLVQTLKPKYCFVFLSLILMGKLWREHELGREWLVALSRYNQPPNLIPLWEELRTEFPALVEIALRSKPE